VGKKINTIVMQLMDDCLPITTNAGALRSGDIDLLLLKHLTADWLCTWLRTYSSAPILQNTLLVFVFFCAAEHLFEFKN